MQDGGWMLVTYHGMTRPAPRLPARTGRKIDWEGELGVVIGRRCRDAAAQARAGEAGWTVLNDVSARDRLDRTDAVSEHFGYDWLRHRVADAR